MTNANGTPEKSTRKTENIPKDDSRKAVPTESGVNKNNAESDGGANGKKNEAKKRERKFGNITFEFNARSMGWIAAIIAFAILLYWGLNHTDSLKGFLSYWFSLFSPVIYGFAFAFIINVPMCRLESLWEKLFLKKGSEKKIKIFKKLCRPVCLVLSIVLVLGGLFALLFMILPEFKSSLMSIANSVPKYIPELERWWDSVLEFANGFGAVLPDFSLDANKIMDMTGKLFNSVFGSENGIVNKTIVFTTSLFSGITNIFIAFVFSIYMLAQKEKLIAAVKKLLYAFVPQKKVESIIEFSRMTNRTFFCFVTGQFTEAAILGILCFLGMTVLRMPYAVVVSVLVGVTALIPIFGAFIGTAAGAFLILLSSPMKAFWFIVFVIVLQQIEGNLIYPKVVGKSVGLPGIWVMLSVTVGGKAFGMLGMLLSVPFCAVLYSLLRKTVYERFWTKYGKTYDP